MKDLAVEYDTIELRSRSGEFIAKHNELNEGVTIKGQWYLSGGYKDDKGKEHPSQIIISNVYRYRTDQEDGKEYINAFYPIALKWNVGDAYHEIKAEQTRHEHPDFDPMLVSGIVKLMPNIIEKISLQEGFDGMVAEVETMIEEAQLARL